MKPILIAFLLFVAPGAGAQIITNDTLFSKTVKDKYVITVRIPEAYDAKKKYHHVYMTDGSIGIGDYVFGRSASWAASVPANCVIIAISHTGDWHEQRPRDLIPADISGNTETNFGHADLFYSFLQKELIPLVEKSMPNKLDRCFIGHSFGGLFCLYTLFKEDRLFDKHFAISPSVWANYYELDKIEEAFSKSNKALKADITIYVGGLEFLNKVLFSTRRFYETVGKRNYAGMKITKNEIGNANHFSIRKPAVDRVFDGLR